MKMIYQAFDGTIFEDVLACANYEKKNKINPCEALKNTVLINVDGDLVTPASFMDDPSLPYYMVIHNKEEFDVINNHLKNNHEPNLDEIYLPHGKGCLYWDEDTEQWANYGYLRNNYIEHSQFLEGFYLQM